jgi:membrane-bound serine protease (ClpP class)
MQLAGVGVVIAEIFLPSGGLLSVLAIGLFGYSLFVVFNDISTTVGIYFVIADIVLLPTVIMAGLKMLAYSPMALRDTLSSENGVTSQSPEMAEFLGLEGETLADLHPSGTALIDGKRVDVVSRGEYIDKGSEIIVSEVRGNQIIVREKNR